MGPIPYKKVNEETIKQYNYLKSLDLSLGWRIHQFWIWFYSCITVAVIILYIATASNTLIVLKVMSLMILALMYLIGLIVLIVDAIRRSRHLKKVDLLLNNSLSDEATYSIQFTEETITFITDKIRTEVAWSYWEGYREVDGTLFLFTKDHLYHSTSFSSAEIGISNFESLRSIVKERLPELEEISLKKWYQLVV